MRFAFRTGLLLMVTAIAGGCPDSADPDSTRASHSNPIKGKVVTELPDEDAAISYNPDDDDANRANEMSAAESIKQRHESSLMSIEGVEGVGISHDQSGRQMLMIYLRDKSAGDQVPREIEGLPVHTSITGQIDAY